MANKYKRILLKISGEFLAGTDNSKKNIDPTILNYVAKEISKAVKEGVQVAIVCGGGNIFRGLAASAHGMERAQGDYIGMLATVMNALALEDALEKHGVTARVQSAIEMIEVCEPYIRHRAIKHLERGRVVILAAGTGCPYFTTDTTAALRACELGVDCIFKATKVDGVYDKDPVEHKDAKRFTEIKYIDVLNKELKVMDSTAISLCMDNKIPMQVFDISKDDNIAKACAGKVVGTIID